jgi:hypothetical protein
MTPDELIELISRSLDYHKAVTPVAYKVDRGRLLDGRQFLAISLPGGNCLRVTVEEEEWV